jgi:hypothetical protein
VSEKDSLLGVLVAGGWRYDAWCIGDLALPALDTLDKRHSIVRGQDARATACDSSTGSAMHSRYLKQNKIDVFGCVCDVQIRLLLLQVEVRYDRVHPHRGT